MRSDPSAPEKKSRQDISVITEITDTRDHVANGGRVFFDASCGLCLGLVDRFGPLLTNRGFSFEPLQAAIANREFDMPEEEFHREMKLLYGDNRWFGGADAWIVLLNAVWWLKPLALIAALPGVHWLAQRVYQWIATNRHCLDGACFTEAEQSSCRNVIDQRVKEAE